MLLRGHLAVPAHSVRRSEGQFLSPVESRAGKLLSDRIRGGKSEERGGRRSAERQCAVMRSGDVHCSPTQGAFPEIEY